MSRRALDVVRTAARHGSRDTSPSRPRSMSNMSRGTSIGSRASANSLSSGSTRLLHSLSLCANDDDSTIVGSRLSKDISHNIRHLVNTRKRADTYTELKEIPVSLNIKVQEMNDAMDNIIKAGVNPRQRGSIPKINKFFGDESPYTKHRQLGKIGNKLKGLLK